MTVLYINNNYIQILRTIYILKAATAKTIAILTGGSDETYTRKRLYRLESEGYIGTTRTNTGRKVYFLLDKGIREIGANNRRYEPNSNLYHLLAIGTVCGYLRITEGASAEDMITDIRAGEYIKAGAHRPDIIHGSTAYEIELHSKAQERENSSIYSNSLLFQQQIWIIPDGKKGIITSVQRAAERTGAAVYIKSLSEIENAVKRHRTQDTGKIEIIRREPFLFTGQDTISDRYGRYLKGGYANV